MNSGEPVSTARAIWIIARLALRRQLNIWMSLRFGRRRRGTEPRRSGTPTKSGRRSIFGGLLFLLILFNGFLISSRGLVNISARSQNIVESAGKIAVSPYAQLKIIEAGKALREIAKLDKTVERRKYEGLWNRYLDQLFTSEVRLGAFSEDEENARVRQMHEVFARKGASGFTSSGMGLFAVSATTWPRGGEAESVFSRSLSLLLVLWAPAIVFLSLGANNKDLGQVEWSFEWLYTFPASARALFASKLLAYSFLNPIVWWLFFPFAVLMYVAGGCGLMAVGLGLLAVLYLAFLAGGVTLVVEVALRKFLSLSRLKNTQALFSVLGMVCLLLFYASTFSRPVVNSLTHHAAMLPELMIWNPFSLPVIAAIPEVPAWQRELSVLAMIGGGFAAGCLALLASEWLTRDGLIKSAGPYQGTRGRSRVRTRRSWLRGISAQEMLLLSRDRNLMVQVLVVPLLFPAYYLVIDTHMRSALTGNFRRAAMMGFAVGAYSFLNSAMPLLSREDKTLWHLLTFPRSLVSILFSKAMVWAAVGLAYGGGLLWLVVHFSPHLRVSSWGYVFLALYGIALYAFIASGIGILMTNVMEVERQSQLRPATVYLYFVLAAMYATVFYSVSLWSITAQLVLTTLFTFALWQKVKDLCPYILDPTQWPPRTISVADGLIAALAFFVVQAVTVIFLHRTSAMSLSAQITVAYILAGIVVTGAVLYTFWLQGVPDLWQQIGFGRADIEGGRTPAVRGFVQGALWGAAAALGACAYLHALGLFSAWRIWRQDAELSSFLTRADQPLWICALLILAAPVVEEFLFRGLVFQGLRRSTGPVLAVVGSAALFALVHPPIAVIPVFGLGIAAAISFNRSRFLLAPVAAHAVYNGCILLFNRL